MFFQTLLEYSSYYQGLLIFQLELIMDTKSDYKLLRVALVIFWLIFIFALYPLTLLLPSG
jgi:hypothetical protein